MDKPILANKHTESLFPIPSVNYLLRIVSVTVMLLPHFIYLSVKETEGEPDFAHFSFMFWYRDISLH